MFYAVYGGVLGLFVNYISSRIAVKHPALIGKVWVRIGALAPVPAGHHPCAWRHCLTGGQQAKRGRWIGYMA